MSYEAPRLKLVKEVREVRVRWSPGWAYMQSKRELGHGLAGEKDVQHLTSWRAWALYIRACEEAYKDAELAEYGQLLMKSESTLTDLELSYDSPGHRVHMHLQSYLQKPTGEFVLELHSPQGVYFRTIVREDKVEIWADLDWVSKKPSRACWPRWIGQLME